jgi:hypothetical protein
MAGTTESKNSNEVKSSFFDPLFRFRKKLLNPILQELVAKTSAAMKTDDVADRVDHLLAVRDEAKDRLSDMSSPLEAATGKPMYAMPNDAPLVMTLNQAKDLARTRSKENANGHGDWRVPTKGELNVMFNNRAAIGGFNESGADPSGWYCSSSPYPYPGSGIYGGLSWSQSFSRLGWSKKFSTGYEEGKYANHRSSVRLVR